MVPRSALKPLDKAEEALAPRYPSITPLALLPRRPCGCPIAFAPSVPDLFWVRRRNGSGSGYIRSVMPLQLRATCGVPLTIPSPPPSPPALSSRQAGRERGAAGKQCFPPQWVRGGSHHGERFSSPWAFPPQPPMTHTRNRGSGASRRSYRNLGGHSFVLISPSRNVWQPIHTRGPAIPREGPRQGPPWSLALPARRPQGTLY
jgi:hypothetical protein